MIPRDVLDDHACSCTALVLILLLLCSVLHLWSRKHVFVSRLTCALAHHLCSLRYAFLLGLGLYANYFANVGLGVVLRYQ